MRTVRMQECAGFLGVRELYVFVYCAIIKTMVILKFVIGIYAQQHRN